MRPRRPTLTLAFSVALWACNGEAREGARGRACKADGECGGLACVADLEAPPEDLAPLPLVCGDPIEDGVEPGGECSADSVCGSGVCVVAGACVAPCATSDDCAQDERCAPVYARVETRSLQTLTACVRQTDLPDGVEVDVELRADALQPEMVEIELPRALDGGSTLYVLQHEDEHWPEMRCRPPLCVRSLRTAEPVPRVLFDAALDYAVQDAPLNAVATGDHLNPAVIALPAGSAGVSSTGGYVAELAVESAGDLTVTRLARTGTGQQLDLNVFYLGGLGWQPESERGPALLEAALEVVGEILGQADIFIGEVRQLSVPGELPELGIASPDGHTTQGFSFLQVRYGVYLELPYLFRLSAGASNTAVNLFFLRDIQPRTEDGDIEAEAGGIPGPLGMHGTGGSGIAIATDMMAGDPRRLGRTLAHELAHFLGLFHTSEADGRVFDPLEDTPECRPEQDTAGDGLNATDCAGLGSDNLMFWAAGTGTVLTEDQRAVLRRALILH